jgi:hypothetical protein
MRVFCFYQAHCWHYHLAGYRGYGSLITATCGVLVVERLSSGRLRLVTYIKKLEAIFAKAYFQSLCPP